MFTFPVVRRVPEALLEGLMKLQEKISGEQLVRRAEARRLIKEL